LIVGLAERPGAAAEAEAIFWESAGTKTFASGAERTAYRDLWFGRYLEHAPGEFFLALGDDSVIGYLAGSVISDAPPLPGPDYYPLFPAELIAHYPAHIHVNVRADHRGRGIGAELVHAFAQRRRTHEAAGFHAVTAEGSRSAAFFEKCGLRSAAGATWLNRPLKFLVSAS
jgi:GNAT superfamily N-acetyltransferase